MNNHKAFIGDLKNNDNILNAVSGFLNSVPCFSDIAMSGKKVLLKPNFVAPFTEAVTDFRIIEATAGFVRAKGGTPFIAESSGFEFSTEKTFSILGVEEYFGKLGIETVNIDTEEFIPVQTEDRTFPVIKLARRAVEADLIFNLPRIKRHSLTVATLSSKNLMGLIHRDTRRLFHSRDIERGIAVLTKAVKSNMILADGLYTLSKAVYGDSQFRGAIIAGTDSAAVDKACCTVLGIDSQCVGHLRKLTDPSAPYETEVKPDPNCPVDSPKAGFLYKLLFKAAFLFDRILAAAGNKKSIIPLLHWYFGIRPAIGNADCEALKRAAEICPVKAIDVTGRKIIRERCMMVRCLRCAKVEPAGSFIIRKGFRKL